MKVIQVVLCASLVFGVVVKDPAKCVKYEAGTNSAGSWEHVKTATTREACQGQWILGWGQSVYPDHHPVPKSWWTKRMSDTGGADADNHDRLYFGGRPSVRDMKQLYEAGFDAVLSLEDAEEGEKIGIQPLPTTEQARAIAAEAGLLFHALLKDVDFTSVQGVDEITNFIDFALANTGQENGNGPIYVFDKAGFKAAAALQLYRARKGLIPKVSSKSITERATLEGNFHGIEFPTSVINAIAREAKDTVDPVFPNIRKLDASVRNSLTNYHWLKYLYHIGNVGVYDAGQIQTHHVSALKAANVKVIINMRQGTLNSEGFVDGSTMEPVNLLNLEFGDPTKGITDAKVFAQEKAAFIIDKDRPASWACQFESMNSESYKACQPGTDSNFETANPLEWGDIGMNAFKEGDNLKDAGIVYYHLPVGAMQKPDPIPFNGETFAKYAPQFIEAVNIAQKLGGNLLFHCTIGYRTGAFPTALLSILKDWTFHEANTMMHSWGYDVADEQTGHIFEKGSNKLFSDLNSLKFQGNTDWNTGRIDGQITLLNQAGETAGKTPAKENPAPGSERGAQGTGRDDDDDSIKGIVVAALIFAMLAFIAASGGLYVLYKRPQHQLVTHSDHEVSQSLNP